jgi:hypothetical protein
VLVSGGGEPRVKRKLRTGKTRRNILRFLTNFSKIPGFKVILGALHRDSSTQFQKKSIPFIKNRNPRVYLITDQFRDIIRNY